MVSCVAAQDDDQCHTTYHDQAACDAQKGVCTWCKCGALPSSCWTVDNAKKLPPSVYICDSLNASIHNSNRLQLVDAINRANTSWKAGLNSRFVDKPVGVSKSLCGVKSQSREELLDLVERGIVKTEAHLPRQYLALEIPDSFDSAAAWPACAAVIDDIRDQSNCGCCWAFAAASAASDRMCIQTNGSIQVPLSAQATCFCAESNGCGGGTLYTPWAYIQSSGVVTGGQYNGTGPLGSNFCSDFSLPHCHHHGPQGNDPYPAENTPGCPSTPAGSSPQCPTTCKPESGRTFATDKYGFKGTVYMYRGEQSIQAAILQHGPVEAAFSVYEDFENYVSGVYQQTSGSMVGGHAVRIVGWGVDAGVNYWKIANSWNPYWGENGYFRMIRGGPGMSGCGIEDQVTASGPEAVWAKQ